MSERRPKPTQLKEKTSGQAADRVGLSRLFAHANEIVAQRPQLKLEDAPAKAPVRESKPTVVYTRSTASPPSATQIKRTEFADLPQTRVTSSRARAKLSPWLFLLPAFALIVYVVLAPDSGLNARRSRLSASQIEDRLELHRGLTGSQLNRERIDVQIQNHFDAPDLPASVEKVKQPDMMAGLPLEGERPTYTKKPDRVVNPSDPEAKIMYGLQEEQERNEYEVRARQAWMNEFIANARRDGVAIKVDKFGNVESEKIPQKLRDPAYLNETGTSGGVNSGASVETSIDN